MESVSASGASLVVSDGVMDAEEGGEQVGTLEQPGDDGQPMAVAQPLRISCFGGREPHLFQPHLKVRRPRQQNGTVEDGTSGRRGSIPWIAETCRNTRV